MCDDGEIEWDEGLMGSGEWGVRVAKGSYDAIAMMRQHNRNMKWENDLDLMGVRPNLFLTFKKIFSHNTRPPFHFSPG